MDWFEKLTGFREANYDETRAKLSVEGSRLRSLVNSNSYEIGQLELVSLRTLRKRAESGPRLAGRLKVRVVRGDVRKLHQAKEYAGALFQVASQFNLLEMTCYNVTPEHGVTRYQCDHTQGPACAIAAGAATIYRNYFAPVGGGHGQTKNRQFDGLADLGNALSSALGQPVQALWKMQNGYALCTPAGLDAIADHLGKLDADEVDELRDKLCIGIHRDIEVTVAAGNERPPLVSQAFCSALPVAYTRIPHSQWQAFASLVLQAAYEATMWAAMHNAQRGASNVVLLTTLGGLCLLLRSDDGELEHVRFWPSTEALRSRDSETSPRDDNVLLPAASSLRGFIGQPLRWKVRLSSPPKHALHYYFMRSSFDPDDLDARHNIVETRAPTPSGTRFPQQGIEVELVVREDGTAEPYFIYGRDNLHPGVTVKGDPFFIDMTSATEEVAGETYLGFDFGTSASACSYVDSRDIQIIEQRSRAAEWRELTELVTDLPYPAAAPLARYISEMDHLRRSEHAREAVEGLLTLAAYLTYSERCAVSAPTTALFKGMPHRSAGPLWDLLKNCLRNNGGNLPFSGPLAPLVRAPNFDQIDSWISKIAESKHGKLANIDYDTFLAVLGNHVAKVFAETHFGKFEAVTAKRFDQGRFRGNFRSLAGSSRTFIHVLEYEGPNPFSDAEVFVVNPKTGVGLSLSPLYYWGLNLYDGRNAEPDLYEYDSAKDGKFSFKAVQLAEAVTISRDGHFDEIWKSITNLRERDQARKAATGLKGTSKNSCFSRPVRI